MTTFPPAKYFESLNFMTGCTPASPGCDNCWAKQLHESRRKALLKGKKLPEMYRRPFSEIQYSHDKMNKRIPDGKPKIYLVNSTSDTFHHSVPIGDQIDMLNRCDERPQHRYLLLTKRPENMREPIQLFNDFNFNELLPAHFWLGATCEDQKRADERIPRLLRTPATNRWLSLEPLLGPIDLSTWFWSMMSDKKECAISWVVLGAESGPNRRPCKIEWVRSIVDQCQNANVRCFVKQLDIDGKCVHDIEKFPAALRIRDLPGERV